MNIKREEMRGIQNGLVNYLKKNPEAEDKGDLQWLVSLTTEFLDADRGSEKGLEDATRPLEILVAYDDGNWRVCTFNVSIKSLTAKKYSERWFQQANEWAKDYFSQPHFYKVVQWCVLDTDWRDR